MNLFEIIIVVGGAAAAIKIFKPFLFKKAERKVAQAFGDAKQKGNAAIEEAKERLTLIKLQIQKLEAVNDRFSKQKREFEGETSKFERLAQFAGEAGNANDVEEALTKQKEYSGRIIELTN